MDGRVQVTPTVRYETTPKRITPITPSRTQPTLKDSMLKEFGLDNEKTKPIRSGQQSPIKNTPTPKPPTPTIQNNTTNNTAQPPAAKPAQNSKIYYSNEEITSMLANGYINIMREVWDFLPVGSHVRFFKKAGTNRNERFRPGGYIKKHYETSDGKKILFMETIRNGNSNMADYFTYPMAYDDLAEIWKRYPEDCFVEIHLIYGSLAKKNKQISDLEARMTALEAKIKK